MISRYDDLRRYPTVFLHMPSLRRHAFDDVLANVLPA